MTPSPGPPADLVWCPVNASNAGLLQAGLWSVEVSPDSASTSEYGSVTIPSSEGGPQGGAGITLGILE